MFGWCLQSRIWKFSLELVDPKKGHAEIWAFKPKRCRINYILAVFFVTNHCVTLNSGSFNKHLKQVHEEIRHLSRYKLVYRKKCIESSEQSVLALAEPKDGLTGIKNHTHTSISLVVHTLWPMTHVSLHVRSIDKTYLLAIWGTA